MFDLDPHVALLALAGRVPDGWLAIAREALAGSDTERLKDLLDALAAVSPTAGGRCGFDGAWEGGGPWSDPCQGLMADADERQRVLDFLAGDGPLW
jgi:hypothetical protein